ncbi:MAG: hypothetical protein ACREV3_11940 [Gammaproteobacteria bacterium]
MTTKSSICAWGVLYKSGVYARTVLCPFGKLRTGLPWEVSWVPWDLACERNWLSIERSMLTAEEKPVLSQSKGQQRV